MFRTTNLDVQNARDIKSSRVCRLCLVEEENMIYIFDPKGYQGFRLWEIIKELLQIEVSKQDGLPGSICVECFNQVKQFKQFKTICIKAKITFLTMFASQGMVCEVVQKPAPLRDTSPAGKTSERPPSRAMRKGIDEVDVAKVDAEKLPDVPPKKSSPPSSVNATNRRITRSQVTKSRVSETDEEESSSSSSSEDVEVLDCDASDLEVAAADVSDNEESRTNEEVSASDPKVDENETESQEEATTEQPERESEDSESDVELIDPIECGDKTDLEGVDVMAKVEIIAEEPATDSPDSVPELELIEIVEVDDETDPEGEDQTKKSEGYQVTKVSGDKGENQEEPQVQGKDTKECAVVNVIAVPETMNVEESEIVEVAEGVDPLLVVQEEIPDLLSDPLGSSEGQEVGKRSEKGQQSMLTAAERTDSSVNHSVKVSGDKGENQMEPQVQGKDTKECAVGNVIAVPETTNVEESEIVEVAECVDPLSVVQEEMPDLLSDPLESPEGQEVGKRSEKGQQSMHTAAERTDSSVSHSVKEDDGTDSCRKRLTGGPTEARGDAEVGKVMGSEPREVSGKLLSEGSAAEGVGCCGPDGEMQGDQPMTVVDGTKDPPQEVAERRSGLSIISETEMNLITLVDVTDEDPVYVVSMGLPEKDPLAIVEGDLESEFAVVPEDGSGDGMRAAVHDGGSDADEGDLVILSDAGESDSLCDVASQMPGECRDPVPKIRGENQNGVTSRSSGLCSDSSVSPDVIVPCRISPVRPQCRDFPTVDDADLMLLPDEGTVSELSVVPEIPGNVLSVSSGKDGGPEAATRTATDVLDRSMVDREGEKTDSDSQQIEAMLKMYGMNGKVLTVKLHRVEDVYDMEGRRDRQTKQSSVATKEDDKSDESRQAQKGSNAAGKCKRKRRRSVESWEPSSDANSSDDSDGGCREGSVLTAAVDPVPPLQVRSIGEFIDKRLAMARQRMTALRDRVDGSGHDRTNQLIPALCIAVEFWWRRLRLIRGELGWELIAELSFLLARTVNSISIGSGSQPECTIGAGVRENPNRTVTSVNIGGAFRPEETIGVAVRENLSSYEPYKGLDPNEMALYVEMVLPPKVTTQQGSSSVSACTRYSETPPSLSPSGKFSDVPLVPGGDEMSVGSVLSGGGTTGRTVDPAADPIRNYYNVAVRTEGQKESWKKAGQLFHVLNMVLTGLRPGGPYSCILCGAKYHSLKYMFLHATVKHYVRGCLVNHNESAGIRPSGSLPIESIRNGLRLLKHELELDKNKGVVASGPGVDGVNRVPRNRVWPDDMVLRKCPWCSARGEVKSLARHLTVDHAERLAEFRAVTMGRGGGSQSGPNIGRDNGGLQSRGQYRDNRLPSAVSHGQDGNHFSGLESNSSNPIIRQLLGVTSTTSLGTQQSNVVSSESQQSQSGVQEPSVAEKTYLWHRNTTMPNVQPHCHEPQGVANTKTNEVAWRPDQTTEMHEDMQQLVAHLAAMHPACNSEQSNMQGSHMAHAVDESRIASQTSGLRSTFQTADFNQSFVQTPNAHNTSIPHNNIQSPSESVPVLNPSQPLTPQQCSIQQAAIQLYSTMLSSMQRCNMPTPGTQLPGMYNVTMQNHIMQNANNVGVGVPPSSVGDDSMPPLIIPAWVFQPPAPQLMTAQPPGPSKGVKRQKKVKGPPPPKRARGRPQKPRVAKKAKPTPEPKQVIDPGYFRCQYCPGIFEFEADMRSHCILFHGKDKESIDVEKASTGSDSGGNQPVDQSASSPKFQSSGKRKACGKDGVGRQPSCGRVKKRTKGRTGQAGKNRTDERVAGAKHNLREEGSSAGTVGADPKSVVEVEGVRSSEHESLPTDKAVSISQEDVEFIKHVLPPPKTVAPSFEGDVQFVRSVIHSTDGSQSLQEDVRWSSHLVASPNPRNGNSRAQPAKKKRVVQTPNAILREDATSVGELSDVSREIILQGETSSDKKGDESSPSNQLDRKSIEKQSSGTVGQSPGTGEIGKQVAPFPIVSAALSPSIKVGSLEISCGPVEGQLYTEKITMLSQLKEHLEKIPPGVSSRVSDPVSHQKTGLEDIGIR